MPESDALRRILQNYAARNLSVGYTQGMNYIAGMVLLGVGVRSEEDAFWILAAIVERIFYPGLYGQDLTGLQVEMRVLDELLAKKLPKTFTK